MPRGSSPVWSGLVVAVVASAWGLPLSGGAWWYAHLCCGSSTTPSHAGAVNFSRENWVPGRACYCSGWAGVGVWWLHVEFTESYPSTC